MWLCSSQRRQTKKKHLVTDRSCRLAGYSSISILVNTCVAVANDAQCLFVCGFCFVAQSATFKGNLWMYCFRFNASGARWTVWVASANYNSNAVSLPVWLSCTQLHSGVVCVCVCMCMWMCMCACMPSCPRITLTHLWCSHHSCTFCRQKPATFLRGMWISEVCDHILPEIKLLSMKSP